MAVRSKFSMTHIGVDFLENREHDGDFRARCVETLDQAKYNVGVRHHVGKRESVEPGVVGRPFLKRNVDKGVDSNIVDRQSVQRSSLLARDDGRHAKGVELM